MLCKNCQQVLLYNKDRDMIFDLDDVIVVPNILKIANEVAGINKKIEDIKTYYMEDTFDFTDEDLELLKEEIKKYSLEDVIGIDDGEYKIVGYGNLQFLFNDDRNVEEEKYLNI